MHQISGDPYSATNLPEQKKKDGKRYAVLFLVGLAMMTLLYAIEGFVLMQSWLFWLLTLSPVAAATFWMLRKGDFDRVPFLSMAMAGRSAFDKQGNLRWGPRLGMTVTVLFTNFLVFGWMLILPVLGLNFIPQSQSHRAHLPIDRIEREKPGLGSGSTTYYFTFEGVQEDFTVEIYSERDPDLFHIKYYRGLLGWPVYRRDPGY